MNKLKFSDFIGNKGAVGKVELLIDEAVKDKFARMPDMAFLGPTGHGKNTLSEVIANETGRRLLTINSTVIRDPFQFRGLIINLKDQVKQGGAIINVDECHGLSRKIQDNLLTATEAPRELHTSHKDQVFTESLPDNFSFIFSTTHSGNIKSALLGRLEIIELLPYSTAEQLEMAIGYLIRKHEFVKTDIDVKCIMEVAKRARSGRQVARFCDTIVRYMKKCKVKKLNWAATNACFEILGVDKNGLTRLDKIMLSKLSQMNTCVGLDTLDAVMPATKKQIKEQMEPYLLKRGFIVRTSSGRMITSKGRKALTGEKK
jgi:Holliday junction DNA helicase RuvB